MKKERKKNGDSFMVSLVSQDRGDFSLKRAHLSDGLKGVSDLSGSLETTQTRGMKWRAGNKRTLGAEKIGPRQRWSIYLPQLWLRQGHLEAGASRRKTRSHQTLNPALISLQTWPALLAITASRPTHQNLYFTIIHSTLNKVNDYQYSF